MKTPHQFIVKYQRGVCILKKFKFCVEKIYMPDHLRQRKRGRHKWELSSAWWYNVHPESLSRLDQHTQSENDVNKCFDKKKQTLKSRKIWGENIWKLSRLKRGSSGNSKNKLRSNIEGNCVFLLFLALQNPSPSGPGHTSHRHGNTQQRHRARISRQ